MFYTFRAHQEDGVTPAVAARCTVPRTYQAKAALDRRIAHLMTPDNEHASFATVWDTIPVPLPAYTVTAPYTTWYASPMMNSWFDWDDWAALSQYDAGGSSGDFFDYNPDLVPPGGCYPNTDTLCLQPLNGLDSSAIYMSNWVHRKPLSEMSDSNQRRVCERAAHLFDSLYAMGGKVFRGAYNSMGKDNHYAHYGETSVEGGGKMHFDPWLLDRAAGGSDDNGRYLLAKTALHEALHMDGEPSHASADIYQGNEMPAGWQWGTQYKVEPWIYLNHPDYNGNKSCMRYP